MGCCPRSTAATKDFVTKFANFAPAVLGSDEFETVKYCQTQIWYEELSVSLMQPSASPISRSTSFLAI